MWEIWTAEQAEYHGEFVDFDPLWSWPKPVQRPHPPILVGGNGPGTEDRVLAYGDGWLPQAGRLGSVAELEQRVASLRERAGGAGKGRIPVTLFGTPPEPELLEACTAAGVDRSMLLVRNDAGDQVLSTLDSDAELLGR